MTNSNAEVQHTPRPEAPLIAVIIELLGEISGTPATDIPPIISSIEPDALRRMYQDCAESDCPEVRFSHYGYDVHISSSRQILVQPADPTED